MREWTPGAEPNREHVMVADYDSADGGMWWLECENPACFEFDDQRYLDQWYPGYTFEELKLVFAPPRCRV